MKQDRREVNEWLVFLGRVRALAKNPELMWDPIHERKGVSIGNSMRPLLEALADYLQEHAEPPRYSGYHHYLPRHVANAFAAFRAEPAYEKLRRSYAGIGDEIPDFVEKHLGGLHRICVVGDVAYLLAVASEPATMVLHVRHALEAYSGAQQAVVDHAWRAFCRVAYRDALAIEKTSTHRTLQFKPDGGRTTLTMFSMAGRISFEFSRAPEGAADGASCSYVADDGDPTGQRSGANTTGTRYDVCVAMIEEITFEWNPKQLRHPRGTW